MLRLIPPIPDVPGLPPGALAAARALASRRATTPDHLLLLADYCHEAATHLVATDEPSTAAAWTVLAERLRDMAPAYDPCPPEAA